MGGAGKRDGRMLDEFSRLDAARDALAGMCRAALTDPALEPLAQDGLLELGTR